MKTFINAVICAFLAVALFGCFGYSITKNTPPPEPVEKAVVFEKAAAAEEPEEDVIIIKMGKKRSLRTVLNEMLAEGELVDKDTYGRVFGEYEYTWELWIIEEDGGGFQAAIIEDGILIEIEPVDSPEDARKKHKPYGGWKK